jgi:hypothetical protein
MSEASVTNVIFIKYFLIGDIDTNKSITEYSTNAIGAKEKKNATQIFKRICKSNERRYEERNIISAKDNKYYFSLFQPNIVFIVYADISYPEKLIFTMFDEVRNEKVLSMVNEETKELNPNGRQSLKQIIEKYQDKEKIDKIASIQKVINDVKIDVKENLKKMAENVEDIQSLEERANELANSSIEYEKSAIQIKKLNLWQNFKLMMPFFFAFVFLVIIIIWIFS